ncbi:TrkH family potassium uptake protein [Aeromonas simiae]|uniref:TrkH family potassium uptake protein n=1 Tax=Aeromonas simiae TaxID=218936 RepID=UPI00266BA4D0|nr:TrkH family potassium uptake protein [Aeromonas simiae]MDO2949582.1 TrkH family potassium uptake protein [Aeromonas simiae]MDO2953240.1 TrkH family potassium uptake protein [Aeromonas simiae]MDO2956913.1 TrkH family potassium uptake protein [Aeromonas simiae]
MIKLRPILFTLGLVLSKLALFMWLPTLLALLTGTEGFVEFLKSVLITHAAAFLCLHYGRQAQFRLGVREMFLLTTSVWAVVCIFGALPFVFINHIDFTDAYFEAMSGVTTTGSTVLSGLDRMAHSILLWRSILQWLGGVGFIVMAVAVLPYLNVGGMKLFQTESSDWSDKSAPRAKTVANNIVLVYLVLSMLCFLAYWASGMNTFEAVNHAMTTLSTGGYSTSDQSMSHFSHAAHWIGTLFMFLGGLPFLLYVQSLARRDNSLINDAQVRGFFWLVVWTTVIMTLYLWQREVFGFWDALRISCFNIVSVLTTTGYGLGDFGTWGPLTSLLFLVLLAIGACSGSTAGGLKIFRIQLSFALFRKQMLQLMHPSGVFPQKYNGRPVNEGIVRSMVAFVLAYFAVILVIAALLTAVGLDPLTAISGSITAVANVGPGMGPVIGPSTNFATLPDSAKWLLSFGMMLGRLEILTVAVLFFPSFWRQ